MFTEELNLIKDSETKAEALRKDARAEAKRRIGEANAKAGQIAADAEAEAKAIYDALLKEGQETAALQYDEAIADAHKLCQELAIKSGEKEKQVIGIILERIVESSVNY